MIKEVIKMYLVVNYIEHNHSFLQQAAAAPSKSAAAIKH